MSIETDKDLETLLRFDGLARAEELTGTSYKEDEGTVWTGMILMHANAKAKETALMAQDDSVFSNDLDRYLRIIDAEGFRKVFEMDIPETSDKFFVFWHDDGILLKFDTYRENRVNGGNFYYNWKPNSDADRNVTSSRSPGPDGCIVGNHDCREAIRFHIRRLREEGQFLNPWLKRPSAFWMLSYKDHNDIPHKYGDKTYDNISAERIAQFPEDVQKALGCE